MQFINLNIDVASAPDQTTQTFRELFSNSHMQSSLTAKCPTIHLSATFEKQLQNSKITPEDNSINILKTDSWLVKFTLKQQNE